MFNTIRDTLDRHESTGGISFRDLCAECNAYSPQEQLAVRRKLQQVHFSQLGDCSIVGSTILFPQRVGLPHGDGVDRHPRRHGIDYAYPISSDPEMDEEEACRKMEDMDTAAVKARKRSR